MNIPGRYSYKDMSSLRKTANHSQSVLRVICPEINTECIVYFFVAVGLVIVILLVIGLYLYKKYGCPCWKQNSYQIMDETSSTENKNANDNNSASHDSPKHLSPNLSIEDETGFSVSRKTDDNVVLHREHEHNKDVLDDDNKDEQHVQNQDPNVDERDIASDKKSQSQDVNKDTNEAVGADDVMCTDTNDSAAKTSENIKINSMSVDETLNPIGKLDSVSKEIETGPSDTEIGQYREVELCSPADVTSVPLTVQVFSAADTSFIHKVIDELKTKFELDSGLKVAFSHIHDITSANQEDPLLIICLNKSRLGTDVANALKGILLPKTAALLILNHKEIHALPQVRSDQVLLEYSYDRIAGIFDFAYLETSGMYPCDMNTTFIRDIEGYLREFKKPM